MTAKHEQLKALFYKGARNKNLIITDSVLDRITFELSEIEILGFTDYFILFSRIVEICNELNILRSCGRGSATSSLVNYCLDITKINPISEGLIFEQFVSPKQNKIPDIDIDVPKGQQKKVIEKLKQKFPEYNAYFIAFSPQTESDYDDVVYNNTIYKKHPCGVIITTEKLTDSTFVYEEQEFYYTADIANDKYYQSKIDILELEYLNRLQLIVNEIGEEYHPYRLPLNDKQVFDFFTSGELENIFQFDTNSQKKILTQFKPNSIHDLTIINAMFRPNLLNFIPIIIRNKFDSEDRFGIRDKRVSEILKETYGFLIYQETFLHLSKEIAGISYEEAALWKRKIWRDKSNKESISFRNVFSNGCREHSSLNEFEIESLTWLVSEMLNLLFQKSHSISYTQIGYWGAYYKTHFRAHFEKAFNPETLRFL